jgi:hypothetical protein
MPNKNLIGLGGLLEGLAAGMEEGRQRKQQQQELKLEKQRAEADAELNFYRKQELIQKLQENQKKQQQQAALEDFSTTIDSATGQARPRSNDEIFNDPRFGGTMLQLGKGSEIKTIDDALMQHFDPAKKFQNDIFNQLTPQMNGGGQQAAMPKQTIPPAQLPPVSAQTPPVNGQGGISLNLGGKQIQVSPQNLLKFAHSKNPADLTAPIKQGKEVDFPNYGIKGITDEDGNPIGIMPVTVKTAPVPSGKLLMPDGTYVAGVRSDLMINPNIKTIEDAMELAGPEWLAFYNGLSDERKQELAKTMIPEIQPTKEVVGVNEIPAPERVSLNAQKAISTAMGNVIDVYEQRPDIIGIIPNLKNKLKFVGTQLQFDYKPGDDPELADFGLALANLSTVTNLKIKELTGATVGQGDETKRLMSQLPQLTNSPDQFMATLYTIAEQLQVMTEQHLAGLKDQMYFMKGYEGADKVVDPRVSDFVKNRNPRKKGSMQIDQTTGRRTLY